jgi:L-alanine-DL-glutamate epimerase-like enolase superfamily enzyme
VVEIAMKITDVVTHVLSTPLDEPFAFSQGWCKKRGSMIVEILTDDGVVGWGESLCHGMQPPEIAASFVEFCFKPLLIGRDPFDVEVLWEEMYNITRPFGQAGAAVNAISGVDIALWDVIGRALNKPIHKLIGGAFRTGVERLLNKGNAISATGSSYVVLLGLALVFSFGFFIFAKYFWKKRVTTKSGDVLRQKEEHKYKSFHKNRVKFLNDRQLQYCSKPSKETW